MIEHLDARSFSKAAKGALEDATLRGALAKATGLFAERRKTAISSVADWQELRPVAAESLGRHSHPGISVRHMH